MTIYVTHDYLIDHYLYCIIFGNYIRHVQYDLIRWFYNCNFYFYGPVNTKVPANDWMEMNYVVYWGESGGQSDTKG